MKKFTSRVREYQVGKDPESLGKIKGLIEDFKEDSTNPKKEYLAFRQWIVENMSTILRRGAEGIHADGKKRR